MQKERIMTFTPESKDNLDWIRAARREKEMNDMNDIKRRIYQAQEAIAKLQTLEGEIRAVDYEKARELQLMSLAIEGWIRLWDRKLDEIQA